MSEKLNSNLPVVFGRPDPTRELPAIVLAHATAPNNSPVVVLHVYLDSNAVFLGKDQDGRPVVQVMLEPKSAVNLSESLRKIKGELPHHTDLT